MLSYYPCGYFSILRQMLWSPGGAFQIHTTFVGGTPAHEAPLTETLNSKEIRERYRVGSSSHMFSIIFSSNAPVILFRCAESLIYTSKDSQNKSCQNSIVEFLHKHIIHKCSSALHERDLNVWLQGMPGLRRSIQMDDTKAFAVICFVPKASLNLQCEPEDLWTTLNIAPVKQSLKPKCALSRLDVRATS